ncbi:hypothetical protein FQN50_002121 [Emmonsiellopsis sp. PD_5]|nr:hypothetical protein FQN50_002121 [Emmonsiellopsis sp. PD_5]
MSRALFCRSCLHQAASVAKQIRPFSSTLSSPRAIVPSFKPTDSKDLDEILTKYREHVFIPAFLSRPHRKLLYKTPIESSPLLQQPITIYLENSETYQLRPLRLEDTPRNSKLRDVVELMTTPEHWDNLIPLLQGMHSAKRTPKVDVMEFILRKAGEAGMNTLMIECAKQSRTTGLSLRNYQIAELFFSNFHMQAERADFKGPELEKALKHAKQTATLMNMPDHAPVDRKLPDPRRHPNIIGVLLELSAARALDAFEGKDTTGDVVSYAEKLIGTWRLREFKIPEYTKKAKRELTDLPSVRRGIEFALQVEEVKANEKLSGELRNKLEELDAGAKVEASS